MLMQRMKRKQQHFTELLSMEMKKLLSYWSKLALASIFKTFMEVPRFTDQLNGVKVQSSSEPEFNNKFAWFNVHLGTDKVADLLMKAKANLNIGDKHYETPLKRAEVSGMNSENLNTVD